MSIILSIRKFFRLDTYTLDVDTEFTDSVGLWLIAKNEIMKEEFQGCLVKANNIVSENHEWQSADFNQSVTPDFGHTFHGHHL
jgi:hypothetical protein